MSTSYCNQYSTTTASAASWNVLWCEAQLKEAWIPILQEAISGIASYPCKGLACSWYRRFVNHDLLQM